ncbi:MAG: FxsA family protein [Candidatus Nanopelagicales bacterium]|jgi:UPF0716 family protein affecting phage T7 exclusion|nr:FxsA family protein [Candidatus Nanopelagicales bacterium]
MARFATLAVLALLAVAEVAAVMALEQHLGAPTTLLVLGLDMLLGLVVMAWALRTPPPRGWRLLAGAVIALPGLVLDLVGGALLLPPVQRWLATHLDRGAQSLLRRQGMSVITVTGADGLRRTTVVPGDVVPGEVVEPSPADGAGPPPETPNDPAQRPGVIRGELAGPEG